MLLCLLRSLLLCGLTKGFTAHDILALAYVQTCLGKQRIYLRIYTYSTLVQESIYHSYKDNLCTLLPHDHDWLSCVMPCSDGFGFIASCTACIAWETTTADAPSWGRALASAFYAGNHWGMPCTIGQSQLNHFNLPGIISDRLTTSEHRQSCLGCPSICSTMSG